MESQFVYFVIVYRAIRSAVNPLTTCRSDKTAAPYISAVSQGFLLI